ncbi:hypothetical protein [Chryseobacterium indologenes]|uniref:hypothetical protein n=1 Tax=Chryseobacterium indologenes TaxID=253 RepID=UPI0040581D2C
MEESICLCIRIKNAEINKKIQPILVLSILLCLSKKIFAQANGSHPPSVLWKYLENERLKVIFSQWGGELIFDMKLSNNYTVGLGTRNSILLNDNNTYVPEFFIAVDL